MEDKGLIESIQRQCDRIQAEIFEEQNRPLPNVGLLYELKVKKIKLKGELFHLMVDKETF